MLKAGGLEAIATAALGEPILPTLAQRGDLVLIASEREGWDGALGVCVGVDACFAGLTGLAFARVPKWLKAWRVG